MSEETPQEQIDDLPPPKPISGGNSLPRLFLLNINLYTGGTDGMPSWADFMKELEAEEPPPQPVRNIAFTNITTINC